MARHDPQVAIRLPPDVKAFIKAQAQENSSSQNSEIVRAIRAAMKAKGPAEAATSPSHDQNQSPDRNESNDA